MKIDMHRWGVGCTFALEKNRDCGTLYFPKRGRIFKEIHNGYKFCRVGIGEDNLHYVFFSNKQELTSRVVHRWGNVGFAITATKVVREYFNVGIRDVGKRLTQRFDAERVTLPEYKDDMIFKLIPIEKEA